MAEDNPELQAKLRELDHELEVRGFMCGRGRLGHCLPTRPLHTSARYRLTVKPIGRRHYTERVFRPISLPVHL